MPLPNPEKAHTLARVVLNHRFDNAESHRPSFTEKDLAAEIATIGITRTGAYAIIEVGQNVDEDRAYAVGHRGTGLLTTRILAQENELRDLATEAEITMKDIRSLIEANTLAFDYQ